MIPLLCAKHVARTACRTALHIHTTDPDHQLVYPPLSASSHPTFSCTLSLIYELIHKLLSPFIQCALHNVVAILIVVFEVKTRGRTDS